MNEELKVVIHQPKKFTDKCKIELTEDILYQINHKGEHYEILVPEGFKCDGMSYPRYFPLVGFIMGFLGLSFIEVPYLGQAFLHWGLFFSLLCLFFPKMHQFTHASILHDFLLAQCYIRSIRKGDPRSLKEFSRKQKDQIFREVLKQDGVGIIRRDIAYIGVRLNGLLNR